MFSILKVNLEHYFEYHLLQIVNLHNCWDLFITFCKPVFFPESAASYVFCVSCLFSAMHTPIIGVLKLLQKCLLFGDSVYS